jgi:hypothetical protein
MVYVWFWNVRQAAAHVLETLGATTLNAPTDLTVPQLAAIRSVSKAPLDMYVEVPDDLGGYVRHYEVPTMVYCCAPMYIKLVRLACPPFWGGVVVVPGCCHCR